MKDFDRVLADLGIVLPPPPRPVAAYVPFVRHDKLVFISGQLPSRDGRVVYLGKVPLALPLEEAAAAARLATINALAVLRDACAGDLGKVRQIARLGVFVQSADNFEQQAVVANGASTLLEQVFGPSGRHARAAVGVSALPLNAAVEVEMLAICD
jgi:enamine deaminase RidA (YjgF/YER057c/UK114 family)